MQPYFNWDKGRYFIKLNYELGSYELSCPCLRILLVLYSLCLFEKYELPVCLLFTTSTIQKLPLFSFWCVSVMKVVPLFSIWCMYVCLERAPYVFMLVSVYPPEKGLSVFTLVSVCLSDQLVDL